MPTITPNAPGLYEQALTANTEFVVDVSAVGGDAGPAVEVVVLSGASPVYVAAVPTSVTVGDPRSTAVLAGSPVVVPLAYRQLSLAGAQVQPLRLISSAAAVVSLRLLPEWGIERRLSRPAREAQPAAGEATVDVAESALTPGRIGGLSGAAAHLTYFIAARTEQVRSVRFLCLRAATFVPTLVRAGIYSVNSASGDLTLVASTANDPAMVSATNTWVTRPLQTPLAKTAGATYVFALALKAPSSEPPSESLPLVGFAPDQNAPLLRDGRYASGSKGGIADLPSSLSSDSFVTGSGARMFARLLP